MRKVAALAAIVVMLLVGPATGAALAASGGGVDVPWQPRPTDGPLRLDLEELSPRVVTADGPSVVTITGTLVNTGDVTVADIGIRLQRSVALEAEGEVRDALDGDLATDATSPRFQDLPDALAPGQSVAVRLAVPLRGSDETTLALDEPGVHELLVNVNGVPEGGSRARLAAVRMLLPVLGLPPGADGADEVEPDDGVASRFSMIYPIVDVPRRLPTVPGEPVQLSDDELAGALLPGGRLGGLVEALAAGAPDGSAVREAVCVAVDPDLLQTADAMRGGYQVRGPDGVLVPGAGAVAAGEWLDRLTAVLRGTCVIALPFADADVVALTREGMGDQAAAALTDGRQIVADLLGFTLLANTVWPADGVVDDASLATFAGSGARSLVLSADGLDLQGADRFSGVVGIAGPVPATAVVADPLLTTAAEGGRDVLTESSPVRAATGSAAGAVPAGGALGTQDVLGALTFRLTEDPPGSGPLVLAPPRRWASGAVAARALLDGVGDLVDAGRLTPIGLTSAVAAADGGGDDGSGVAARYPLAAGGREVTPAGLGPARATLDSVADLQSSVVEDERGVDTAAVFLGLVQGALRPASAAWRGSPELAAASGQLLVTRTEEVRATLRVLEPPGPFSLGSSSSPLLLTVTNGLPVTMRVRVELASATGLRVAPIPEVEIPPLGRRQVTVNAEVVRSGVFTVNAAVLTRGGEQLGPVSRLQVRSTAYGTITLWLTGTAAVLLVVLVARRILKRAKGGAVPAEDPNARIRLPEDPAPLAPGTAPGERTVPSPQLPRSTPPIPDSSHRDPVPVPVGTPWTAPAPSNAPSRPGPPTGPNRPGRSYPSAGSVPYGRPGGHPGGPVPPPTTHGGPAPDPDQPNVPPGPTRTGPPPNGAPPGPVRPTEQPMRPHHRPGSTPDPSPESP